jgi:hypothetical protein
MHPKVRLIGLAMLALAGCGDDGTVRKPTAAGCAPPSRLSADGVCLEPGVQDDGCAAGEITTLDGCKPAGVSSDWCAEGFVFDAARLSCEPVLPEQPCQPGWMAIPGDVACRPVLACPAESWGGIPVEANTQFVDAAYVGGNSNGSQGQPWTTVGEAVAAADSGAIVAIEAGTYTEQVYLSAPVRLWGVCPEGVAIVGTDPVSAAVLAVAGASSSEIRGIRVSGVGAGIAVTGTSSFLIDQVWVYQTAERGIAAEDFLGPTSVTVRASLVEAATRGGIIAPGSVIDIDSVVVRDTLPALDLDAGRGVEISWSATTGTAADATVRRSVIERNYDIGVVALGSSATIEGTVVRDTKPRVSDDLAGRGITANQDATGNRGLITVRSTMIERNHEAGILVQGSDAVIEGVTVRGTLPLASTQQTGRGIDVFDGLVAGQRSSVMLVASLLEQNHEVGILVAGSDATLHGVRVRETLPRPFDDRTGFGMAFYAVIPTGERANATVKGAMVEDNFDNGVVVFGSEARFDGLLVRGTKFRADDGLYGDGMAMARHPDGPDANGHVVASRIDNNSRAGLAVFGATVTIGSTALVCNAIDLASEVYFDVAVTLDDAGFNDCGCEKSKPCKAISAGIAPPESL